ncbi:MAG: hypothetical protein DRN00_03170 [Thermoplasmata archaeon]|nr:MAG: hypothetical protein DRN00_03170 [Thermoplasmata archaeon]
MSRAIIFKDVWYRYPRVDRWALRDFSIKIDYEECVLIVGPSGSGKSTFIFLARGLHKQFGGELKGTIKLHGKSMSDLDFREITRMGVGWVGQNPALNLHQLTVYDEILSSPIYFNLPWDECERIARDMMKKLRIMHLADRAPSELSGGQMQRVAIAAALTMGEIGGERKILLLDEPSSFLDPVGKEELVNLLSELKGEGATMVIVTHDIQTFLELADRMILIADGRKILEGDPDSVVRSEELDRTVGAPLSVKIEKNELLKKQVRARLERPADKAAEEPAIVLRDVHFEYPDQKVFEGLSCEIPRGRITALIGNNGSGKTTLVKLALGLLKPQRGKIMLLGKNPVSYSAKELASKVSYITQIPSDMFIANTVREECGITPRELGVEKVDEVVENALQVSGLKKLEDASVDSLSGGEQRLLTLACTAFVTDAELLVLDEPEYGVDPNRWWQMFKIFEDLKGRGKTIVMLTHFMDATIFCDHIIVLADGRIVDEGSPAEVYRRDRIKEARIKPPALLPPLP